MNAIIIGEVTQAQHQQFIRLFELEKQTHLH